ncbi:AraC family transcriptional regulator [Agarivorans sp. 1_MG-2023]|uniref:AraC family transcriptional regulator n=1 Tax=Agarivorans sp. 1_MG-2023 TaxID=3062634 RepID=UPI0026E45B52|nr:AraC family transcriptional regulator [Agarivorans sp. 1_MG-2023]MDO6762904.1 AraC family transcriptional regulator [Agarivorans sp. 1_MG-2023]
MDQLSGLLRQFSVTAGVFYSGQLCGLSDVETGDDLVGHIHVLNQGKLSILQANKKIEVTQPSLVFFPKPLAHRLVVDSEQPAELVCATIRYGNANSSPLANALPKQIVLPLAEHPQFSKTIDLLFSEAFQPADGSLVIMDRLVEVLISLLLRYSVNKQNLDTGLLAGLIHPKLSLALALLHEDPSKTYPLETLAHAAAMSRTSFIETFTKVIGSSPGDYLVDWKIHHAQQLLKQGKSIAWVASSVGYQSLSGFNRAFRSKTQMSPKQWLDGQNLKHAAS